MLERIEQRMAKLIQEKFWIGFDLKPASRNFGYYVKRIRRIDRNITRLERLASRTAD